MKPCEVLGCMCPGQKHHIVFKSQGGLDIEYNYKYLCIRHHADGKEAVHNNIAFDLKLKLGLQEFYSFLFQAEEYTMEEIAKLIGYNRARLEKRMKRIPQKAGLYKRVDIIRFLMGGRLYTSSQLEEKVKEWEEDQKRRGKNTLELRDKISIGGSKKYENRII